MDIVIVTLFNNEGWQGPCKNPDKDGRCYICFPRDGAKPIVDIGRPKVDEQGFCTGGECWEKCLCTTKSRWGSYPPGREFGKQAQPGMKAYFVYRQPDGKYTLWGKTMVQDVNVVGEDGKYKYLHFEPFKPLPEDKWARGLAAKELTGKQWRQGRYRYIDSVREAYLERLIEKGKQFEREIETSPSIPGDSVALNIQIKRNIKERLERASDKEGREIKDVVREAIAEWLKGREL